MTKQVCVELAESAATWQLSAAHWPPRQRAKHPPLIDAHVVDADVWVGAEVRGLEVTSDAELGQPSATVQAAGGLAPVAVHAVVGIGAFAPGAPLPFDADAHLEAPAVEPAGAGILVVVDALVVADAAVRILPRAIDAALRAQPATVEAAGVRARAVVDALVRILARAVFERAVDARLRVSSGDAGVRRGSRALCRGDGMIQLQWM